MSPASVTYRIISIGALSVHEHWPTSQTPRTPHATTTLVSSGDRHILVDPGLPPQVISARLTERSGLQPSDITDVFLTNFRPAHRGGLEAFESAEWWVFENERERIGRSLLARFEQEEDNAVRRLLDAEIALLKRCMAAPDKLAPQVDLFPLPGFTPGTCGLLLAHSTSTTVIAGDAVATSEHLERGQVLKGAFDIEGAQESLVEVLEIADYVVPGHDNVILNPARRRT
ncbi:MBL fold metallo-hydrolase [Algisphaera agarilytica]|uniref:Metallo-beta-lactamase domain-containing protein 1 n=1 Tax=Algisphaera agarilytica TaxID=1385975 RepID=A0A7X0H8R8_9BACT|nr:MBL fold metallo-hydrolase [Algisphaera agarilytica]MBB6431218.1 glyoxylase-like metal-dependent hydrolase (beta-lactamase superfamily II) [Algisphaera agarilytica]